MIKEQKRHILKLALSAWVAPVVMAISLPGHAATTECASLPVIPIPLPDFSIGDNVGAPIDAIDISIFGQCGITTPACTGYIATGLPAGLSMSSAGVITGSYNSAGTEVFPVQVNAVLCGENTFIGSFTLTITDEG